jgi:diguanylate cyclase (GGDEF)-like protein
LLVVLLTAGAIVGVTLLVRRVDSSRRAELAIGVLTQTVTNLGAAPYSADPAFNAGPIAHAPHLASSVARQIRKDEATLSAGLAAASRIGAQQSLLTTGRSSLASIRPAVASVYALATSHGGLDAAGGKKVAAAQRLLADRLEGISVVLGRFSLHDAAVARTARNQAESGAAAAMLLLLAVFGYFYFRSGQLARENNELLGLSREEASTDALTGLGNRRALTADLTNALAELQSDSPELLLAIFDLDGFKQYNDTFGHAAGDALLARLGSRLVETVAERGGGYRMGGDEFCVLASCAPDTAEALLDDAIAALCDTGENWNISSSHGAVWIPSEATVSSEALHMADKRMYANKAGRSSTGRQIADVLLQVLSEQNNNLDIHGGHVAVLSSEVAKLLGEPDLAVQRIWLAATLHDVGKSAIPEALLNKRGPLNPQEWEFMHRHTIIGERIVLAAPALANTAPLIRSSHERIDGKGYPDGLRGAEIPLGSRIISACDAFDAMTTNRSYSEASTVEAAVTELRRCSGTQFDPQVIDALCTAVSSSGTAHSTPAIATQSI